MLTFFNVKFWRLKLVANELQKRRLVEILNRKHGLEDTLNAFAVRRLLLIAGAQEEIIGTLLNLDKIRHRRDFPDLPEEPTNPLATSKALSHLDTRPLRSSDVSATPRDIQERVFRHPSRKGSAA